MSEPYRVHGWKAVIALAIMLWCLGSGMYTLALLVRFALGNGGS